MANADRIRLMWATGYLVRGIQLFVSHETIRTEQPRACLLRIHITTSDISEREAARYQWINHEYKRVKYSGVIHP